MERDIILLSGGRALAYSCIGSGLSIMLGRRKGIENENLVREEE